MATSTSTAVTDMCLGIPGRIADFDPTNPHLATVEVTGVRRRINIGLLEDEGLVVGCQPLSMDDGIGLSEPVAAAVPAAAEKVLALLPQELEEPG